MHSGENGPRLGGVGVRSDEHEVAGADIGQQEKCPRFRGILRQGLTGYEGQLLAGSVPAEEVAQVARADGVLALVSRIGQVESAGFVAAQEPEASAVRPPVKVTDGFAALVNVWAVRVSSAPTCNVWSLGSAEAMTTPLPSAGFVIHCSVTKAKRLPSGVQTGRDFRR